MKKRTTIILVSIMMLVLIMGTALVMILVNRGKNGETIADSKSFSSMTDVEVFQNIPAMLVEGAGIGEFADYGEGVYVVDVNGTNLSDYEAYLTTLENSGFQRYYFCDITVDIVAGQEQLPYEDYSGDFNDSSTWCMFTIEGQKCLLGGDGDKGGFKFIMENYDREYMTVDLFSLLHHGHNVKEYFVDYCSVKTVLVTNGGALPAYREKEIAHFKKSVAEWISWEDGTKVFTFPYQVGGEKL